MVPKPDVVRTGWNLRTLVNSSSLLFENASNVKLNVSLRRKKTCISRNISGIYFHLNLTTTFSLQINMLVLIESSNFSKFSCSKYKAQILFHLVFSKLAELHCHMLITNLIFIFKFFFCSNFLFVCNYVINIYLFQ